MIFSIVLWVVNICNFLILVAWPLYNIFWVAKLLRTRTDEIKFLYEDKEDHSPSGPASRSGKIQHIVCQLWLNDDHFLEWRMTENGDVVTHRWISDDQQPKWFNRDRMLYYGPRETETELLRYKIIRTFSVRGIMGWAIRRYVSEAFVMAKIAGFKKYRYTDYIRL